jgi:hypothetical protein
MEYRDGSLLSVAGTNEESVLPPDHDGYLCVATTWNTFVS